MDNYDVVIIGGGPAGLAAAISCYQNGVKSILILERDDKLGGILNQCVHNGFGLINFNEELTGPEYIQRYIDKLNATSAKYKLNSSVIDISKELEITYVSRNEGINTVKAKAIILCTGCRERSRGALNIPGFRPSGVFSTGTAQRLINIEGCNIGKNIVILGSGDTGLIMARRFALEGANVKCVVELMPYSSGSKKNIVQCLDDFDIPLLLSHTIVKINGKDRISSVIVAEVDENKKVIEGSEVEYDCDTLLLSVGLIPENRLANSINIELSSITGGPVVSNTLETSIKGIFSCGNSLHVHDSVDNVSNEGELVGKTVSEYLNSDNLENKFINVIASGGIKYTVPQKIDLNNLTDEIIINFRVDNIYENKNVVLKTSDKEIKRLKKKISVPGQMEQIALKVEDFAIDENTIINLYLED